MKNLDTYSRRISREIKRAKAKVLAREQGANIPDFDIRGRLYALALEMSPNARNGDIAAMQEWGIAISPREVAVDIAAGTGFLTQAIDPQQHGIVYAIDPSEAQLQVLRRKLPQVVTVTGSPDDARVLQKLPVGRVDLVTSFGGLHHVPNHPAMFENIARMLGPNGRFVAADVCDGTALQRHFDEFVSKKCITGHVANWLNEEKVQQISQQVGLEVRRIERVNLTWVFATEREMGLFFKALHAYDLPAQEIVRDLKEALGCEWRTTSEGRQLHLNWPMIFFDLRPRNPEGK